MMTTTDHIGLAMTFNDRKIADVYLEDDGNLAMATRSDAVAQHARQRLMTYHGEWFLDTSCGVKWLDEIMAQRYNPALAESLVKGEIQDTDGIKDIVQFSVRFDRPMRNLNIAEIQANTIYEDKVVSI